MSRFNNIIRSEVTRQLLFWVISFFVLLRLFTRTDSIRTIDVIYTLLFHIPLLFGVGWNQLSMRHFLEKGLRWVYFFAFIMAVIFIVQIYPLTFDLLAAWIFPDYYFITVYEWFEIGGIALIYVSLDLLLYLAKGWFKQQESAAQLAQLKEEKTASELLALRAQINPHFLFNSLNTIYGETMKKSALAPKLVLELSDMLRYVVDHMDSDSVPLKQEVAYLSKYINLQKMRTAHPERISFKASGDLDHLSVPPLLLITFIENCFKHGSVSEQGEYIRISIETDSSALLLKTENTVANRDTLPQQTIPMGLENARRRLQLSQPEAHTLEHSLKGDEFHLRLTLNL